MVVVDVPLAGIGVMLEIVRPEVAIAVLVVAVVVLVVMVVITVLVVQVVVVPEGRGDNRFSTSSN